MLLIETVTYFPFDQELVFLSGHRIFALADFFRFSTLHIFHLEPRTFLPTKAEIIDCFSLGKLGLFIFLLIRDMVGEGAHGRQVSAMFNIRSQDQHLVNLQLLAHLIHSFIESTLLQLLVP